jgi:hypothetical protein
MKLSTVKLLAGISYLFILGCKTSELTLQFQFMKIGEGLFRIENTVQLINAWLQLFAVLALVLTAIRFPKGHSKERLLFLLSSWILLSNSVLNYTNFKICAPFAPWYSLVSIAFTVIFWIAFLGYSSILWNRYYYQND